MWRNVSAKICLACATTCFPGERLHSLFPVHRHCQTLSQETFMVLQGVVSFSLGPLSSASFSSALTSSSSSSSSFLSSSLFAAFLVYLSLTCCQFCFHCSLFCFIYLFLSVAFFLFSSPPPPLPVYLSLLTHVSPRRRSTSLWWTLSANSKHWFTTSLPQPLPLLVTP